MAYLKSVWFGKRQHNAESHAKVAGETLGDGKSYQACVGDNTGVMPAAFAKLAELDAFKHLFFLGCVVHVLDLLVEDIAKIKEIKEVCDDFHFLSTFIKEYSLVYESFLVLQVRARAR